MEKMMLNAQLRDKIGKGPARQYRGAHRVPAVVYFKGKSQNITLDNKEMLHLLKKTSGEKVIINLKFQDGGEKLALIKDMQTHPVTDTLLHVDFLEVSLTEMIIVIIPVMATGEPIGVKRDKGILQHVRREVEIECLPESIPGHLEINISSLEAGRSIHVSDLVAPVGVKILTDPSEVVSSIALPVVAAEAAPAAEEAAAPEVVKKGKKAEEEASEK